MKQNLQGFRNLCRYVRKLSLREVQIALRYPLTTLRKASALINQDVGVGVALDVRDEDTYIVSYPKSGNTWVRFLIGTLYFRKEMDWTNIESYVPDMYRNSYNELEEIQSPRFIKSHHPYNERFPRVIYIVRDVRDIIISGYHYQSKLGNTIDFSKFFDRFIREGWKRSLGTWDFHVRSWLENRENVSNGFMLMKYEDLLNRIYRELERLLSFLEIQREDKEIAKAIDWCSFDNMKKLENQLKNNIDYLQKNEGDIGFVRKGETEQWRKYFTANQISVILDKYGYILEKLGYIE